MSLLVLGKATPEQQEAIDQANAILEKVDLELIGTRPKRRT